jgi:hypothetical protein
MQARVCSRAPRSWKLHKLRSRLARARVDCQSFSVVGFPHQYWLNQFETGGLKTRKNRWVVADQGLGSLWSVPRATSLNQSRALEMSPERDMRQQFPQLALVQPAP